MEKIYWSVIDIGWFLVMTVNMLRFKNPPAELKKGRKNPIVLIPGIGTRWGAFLGFAKFLNSNGYPVYVIPELENNLFPISQSSEIVKKAIEKNKLKNAIIVAHSKGGLIGKYFLIHGNASKKVLGMVSIATPYSGSDLADKLSKNGTAQFSANNPMIFELQKNKVVNKKITSISPSYDTVVWHKNKSDLPNAMENVRSRANGHLNILFDKRLRESVLQSLKKLSN